MKRVYILGDVETTGLSEKTERMTEIALVKTDHEFNIIGTFDMLINPQREISAKITELTGITEDMIINEPIYEDAVPTIKDFWFENADEDTEIIFVAHNAPFDTKFINQAFIDITGEPVIDKWIDTVSIARELYPFWRNHKLDTCAKKFGVVNENHHRALNDTMVLYHIAKRLIPEFMQNELDPVNFRTSKSLHYKNQN